MTWAEGHPSPYAEAEVLRVRQVIWGGETRDLARIPITPAGADAAWRLDFDPRAIFRVDVEFLDGTGHTVAWGRSLWRVVDAGSAPMRIYVAPPGGVRALGGAFDGDRAGAAPITLFDGSVLLVGGVGVDAQGQPTAAPGIPSMDADRFRLRRFVTAAEGNIERRGADGRGVAAAARSDGIVVYGGSDLTQAGTPPFRTLRVYDFNREDPAPRLVDLPATGTRGTPKPGVEGAFAVPGPDFDEVYLAGGRHPDGTLARYALRITPDGALSWVESFLPVGAMGATAIALRDGSRLRGYALVGGVCAGAAPSEPVSGCALFFDGATVTDMRAAVDGTIPRFPAVAGGGAAAYLIGGESPSPDPLGAPNPATGQWSLGAPLDVPTAWRVDEPCESPTLPCPRLVSVDFDDTAAWGRRRRMGAAATNPIPARGIPAPDEILLVGGVDGNGQPVNEEVRLAVAPDGSLWTLGQSAIGPPRVSPTVFTLDTGTILVMGGWGSVDGSSGGVARTSLAFNPAVR